MKNQELLATYNQEGEAQLKYQSLKEKQPITCNYLPDGLHGMYGPMYYEDFFGDCTQIKQTETIMNIKGNMKFY